MGYLMSFMSFRLIIKLVEGNPAPFVFLYSTGNLLSLMSSGFLSGPQRQFKYVYSFFRELVGRLSDAFWLSLQVHVWWEEKNDIHSLPDFPGDFYNSLFYTHAYWSQDWNFGAAWVTFAHVKELNGIVSLVPNLCDVASFAVLLVQMCASLWYTLSYIPYGRATAQRMIRSALAMDGEWTMHCIYTRDGTIILIRGYAV